MRKAGFAAVDRRQCHVDDVRFVMNGASSWGGIGGVVDIRLASEFQTHYQFRRTVGKSCALRQSADVELSQAHGAFVGRSHYCDVNLGWLDTVIIVVSSPMVDDLRRNCGIAGLVQDGEDGK